MMYIHYCEKCCRIHLLNGHKTYCPICSLVLTELPLSYLEYIEMSLEERKTLLIKLSNFTKC